MKWRCWGIASRRLGNAGCGGYLLSPWVRLKKKKASGVKCFFNRSHHLVDYGNPCPVGQARFVTGVGGCEVTTEELNRELVSYASPILTLAGQLWVFTAYAGTQTSFLSRYYQHFFWTAEIEKLRNANAHHSYLVKCYLWWPVCNLSDGAAQKGAIHI